MLVFQYPTETTVRHVEQPGIAVREVAEKLHSISEKSALKNKLI